MHTMRCILHLEDRTLLELFFFMLHEGLANAQGILLEQMRDTMSMSERGKIYRDNK
jgi:hypothetical protein